ncbi:MAG: hypothetical protein ACM3PF_11170 [Bacteroidota bacterium]
MSARFAVRLLLAAAIAASGCSIHAVDRTTVRPERVRAVPRQASFLKAHMRDGSVFVLADWQMSPVDSAIEGAGQRLDMNRAVVASGRLRAPFDSVVLFETNEVRSSGAAAAYTVLWTMTAVGTIVCITNPKACFGSCPTFYDANDPGGPVLAEGFSASIAPFLEDTDVDAIGRVRPKDGLLRLRLTNEALETHVIRRADILAVPRGTSPRAARDVAGGYDRIDHVVPPRAARAEEGDCAAALASFDGVERFSRADSADLATKETIDLEFAGDSPGERGVLVSARQSLLTTYLFYQTLAYLGTDAGRWFASMERGNPALRSRLGGLGAAMGLIEVWVENAHGDWIEAGRAGETGPIATDTYLVRLPADTPRPAHVRLRMSRGMWRIDAVALAHLAGPAEPERIRPARVLKEGRADPEALAALTGSSGPLVTMPGDEYVIEYRVSDPSDRYEYFLEARGYYLEWMRPEWAKETSQERLVECFLTPNATLRRLAPEYKRIEAGMESQFWGSRYERR